MERLGSATNSVLAAASARFGGAHDNWSKPCLRRAHLDKRIPHVVVLLAHLLKLLPLVCAALAPAAGEGRAGLRAGGHEQGKSVSVCHKA